MPELPEVENLRIGLARKIVGQKIKNVKVLAPKLVAGAGNVRAASRGKTAEFIKGITGEVIERIERRAKNLIFRFRGGGLLLVHLKMSGQFVYREGGEIIQGGHPIRIVEIEQNKPGSRTFDGAKRQSPKSKVSLPGKHTHIIFELSRGTLFYNDIRTFGYLLYFKDYATFEKKNHFKKIGPEPLSKDFTLARFARELKTNNSKLKIILLSQKAVAGLGNIYADEVCFEAGVRPTRRASSLNGEEIKKLYAAIKRILKRAIETGGSSVATYMLLDESRGNYAREHKVYGRGGEECANCGKKLKSITLGGRTTVFCVGCER
jgi:formamidopyrimidine-DNA glycosylase